MVTFRAPSGASEGLRHVVDLANRDLQGLLNDLDTHQQGQFWENLHGYALARAEHRIPVPHLIASPERVDRAVREALELADEKFAGHLEALSGPDRERFWRMLHEHAEQQQATTRHPKARHGGT
ncbi:MAG TPA: hypothetical protein VKX45_00645 [Bryobacteraceae bacterium]|jgi:hypothetical protein|nr:hypothetical protein [Bryobacteraceae bacterium]